jgi:hypothetical protein
VSLPVAVPVFLISFNRGATLRRAVDGVRRLQGVGDVIVHDNGSDDAQTLQVLRELEKDGVSVQRRGRIASPSDLNLVDASVAAYFAGRPRPTPYVVSDCDIDMSVAAPHALGVYGELLDRHPRVGCVGPMLRIRDVPRSYPLFNRVMNRHIEQFWRRRPTIVATSWGPAAILKCEIDTTFALHRAGAPFRRMKPALRVYEPYDARHLDWYPDETEEAAYRDSSAPGLAHWNNRVEIARYAGVRLKRSKYWGVSVEPGGGLRIVKTRVQRLMVPSPAREKVARSAG